MEKRLLRKKNWKAGNSSTLSMMAMCILLALSAAVGAKSYDAMSRVKYAQMMADVVSDASITKGNSGWGIVEKDAKAAAAAVTKLNQGIIEKNKVSATVKTAYIDDTGKIRYNAKNSFINGVTAKAEARRQDGTALSVRRDATARMIYYGGMAVVKYAYSFTRNANPGNFTRYMWGAGRGDGISWKKVSDCSSFVAGVFRDFGYERPAYTGSMELMGTEIQGLDNARPGDILLYFSPGSNVSHHVAIYAGKTSSGQHMQVHNSGVGIDCVFGPVPTRERIMVRRVIQTSGKQYAKVQDNANNPNLTLYESQIVNTMRQIGMPDTAIAAMVGNWTHESGCIPSRMNGHIQNGQLERAYSARLRLVGSGKPGAMSKAEFCMVLSSGDGVGDGGYGLAQWTQTSAGDTRKGNLWDFIVSYGGDNPYKFADAGLQASFAIKEMQQSYYSTYRTLMNANPNGGEEEVRRLASYFFQYYEAGGVYDVDGTLASRQKYAVDVFRRMGQ